MVEVYYFMPKDDVPDVVECGIKLSEKADRTIFVNGYKQLCMTGVINPDDDSRINDPSHFICLKLSVNERHCLVGDRVLYEAGLKDKQLMELYYESVISLGQYIFGTFRRPECLITCSILPEDIKVLNRRMDSPILVESSEELYVNNLIEYYKESYPGLNDVLLGLFFEHLTAGGVMEKVFEDEKTSVFKDKNGRIFTSKKTGT